MQVFGELQRAQIENLSADPTGTGLVQTRVWYNTTSGEFKFYDGAATRVLADLDTAQTILNKILTDPNFDASAVFDHITTPSNPAAGKVKIYSKNDNKLYILDSSGVELELGSGGGGGGINHIDNPDANIDTTGWSTYADAAGAKPVDGTGGSPTTTFTRNTSSPLRGDADFLITKDAANRQGEGASYDFSVDNTDQSSAMTISFDATTSANYADDDIGVFIYDVTNASLIEPVSFDLKAGSNGKFEAQFQTAPDSTSYRLIFHIASTNATAYTVNIDNVQVGPSQVSHGAPVSDWKTFTPTGSWTGAVSYTGQYRRVGDSLEATVRIELSGAPTGSTLSVDVPLGLSIDTSKLEVGGSNNQYIEGSQVNISDTGTAQRQGVVRYESAVLVRPMTLTVSGSNIETSNINLTAPHTWANTDNIKMSFKVPIQGWGSSVQMSDSDSTRGITVQAYGNGGTVLTGGTTDIDFTTEDVNSHAAWSTDTFTAPVTGDYVFTGNIKTTASVTIAIDAYVNASQKFRVGAEITSDTHDFSGQLRLNAGDALTFRSTGAATLSNSAVQHNLSISRVMAGQKIAANELVAARYTSDAGQTMTTGSQEIIDFEDADFDTHNSVTTGASWKFTAPVSGKYRATAFAQLADTTFDDEEQYYIDVFKNGSRHSRLYYYEAANTQATRGIGGSSSALVNMVEGDYIDFRLFQSSGTNTALQTFAGSVWATVERVGF